MDREIASEIRRRRTLRRLAAVGIALAAIVFSFAATLNWLRPSVRSTDLQTAVVDRGSVDATLQASGTTMPAVEQVVSSPVEARVLRIVRRAGDHVRVGDELVALDTSESRLAAERLTGSLTAKASEQAQLRLEVEETVASLGAQIEQKKLDADILRFKAEQNERLYREGLVSSQENLAAATALKKVHIELSQLGDALERARRTGEAKLAAASSDLQTIRRERDQSQRQLELAMMRADRDGVVTSIVPDAGATLRKGDVVARIADLSSYRVSATISDIYASRLAPGMRVRVKVDDATSIGGTVASIDPRVENGSVRFWVDLDQPSNSNLRNNLRVDVYVITGGRNDVVRVRRGDLGQADREEVFVVRGGDLVRVPVHWGLAGEDHIEVAGGLREGDRVVISGMNDYLGVKRLRLK